MKRLVAFLLLLALATPSHADEDAGARLLESGDVFVEAEVDPAEGAVVGQRISLLLDLGTTNWFSGAPTLPEPEIEGALVRRFGNQAVNASDNRGGETYAVQTWTWWVYPRRAGTFEVPALDVVMRTVDDERNKVEVRARTKPFRFEVSLPPDAASADVLTASRFVLEQTLEPEPEGLKVGDALRRTLTMRADDVPGMLLPPVTLSAPEGMRPYPDAPRVEDEHDRGTLQGLRVQSTSWILEREGDFVLPEIRVAWWNLEAGAWEEAVAESVTFTVAPNPDAVLGGTAAEDDVVADEEQRVSPWRLGALLGGLLLLLLLLVWIARRLPAWRGSLAAARERRRTSEPAMFRRFEDACRTNDPRRSRDALRAWLDRAAGPDVTVEVFVTRIDEQALTREAQKLGDRLYGRDASAAWQGAGLSSAVAHARTHMQTEERPDPVERRPLNPREALTRP